MIVAVSLASVVAGLAIALAYILVGHGYYGFMLAIAYAILFAPLYMALGYFQRRGWRSGRLLFLSFALPAAVIVFHYLVTEPIIEFIVVLLFAAAGLFGGLIQFGLGRGLVKSS